jgi:hypothetical protein
VRTSERARKLLRRWLPSSWLNVLRTVWMLFVAMLPRRFKYIVFRAESLPTPDLHDLTIEIVEPRQALSQEAREFILQELSEAGLRTMLRWQQRGEGWIFLARCEGEYCNYTMATPARRESKLFPVMCEPKALQIGPGYTNAKFRGRAIHPRVRQNLVRYFVERGYGPFYGAVLPHNQASIRVQEKAGFVRCGVWVGTKALWGWWITSRRISD